MPEQPDELLDLQSDREADQAVRHAVGEALPVDTIADLGVTETVESTLLAEASSPAPVEEPPAESAADLQPGRPSLVLEKKHPMAIRWMHWINFPVLFTMIWSGLLIYWNDSDNAYLHPHRVYRIGVGTWTLFRFFPDWFYNKLDVPFNVTKGLGYHFFFMWIFALNGILYVAYLLWSREWKFMVPMKRSFAEAIQVTLVDLHLRKQLPEQTKYNGAQRIAYTSVLLMGFGSLVTGLAIYKPTQTHWLTTLLGGYEMARWLHFLLTIGFCAFFLVHVAQVILAGWNNFRSMVSGYELRRGEEPSIEAARAEAQGRQA